MEGPRKFWKNLSLSVFFLLIHRMLSNLCLLEEKIGTILARTGTNGIDASNRIALFHQKREKPHVVWRPDHIKKTLRRENENQSIKLNVGRWQRADQRSVRGLPLATRAKAQLGPPPGSCNGSFLFLFCCFLWELDSLSYLLNRIKENTS